MNSSSNILKLGVRSNDYHGRDITIRLTWRSLFLVVWMGIAFILMYEIAKFVVSMLFTRFRRNVENHTKKPPPVWLVLAWAISTLYGVFYSFEVIFLYINDEWYQLLGLQVFMTLTDTITWIYMIRGKYNNSMIMMMVVCGIKVLHLAFNLLVEANVWMIRHFLFLLEDATYLALMSYHHHHHHLRPTTAMIYYFLPTIISLWLIRNLLPGRIT